MYDSITSEEKERENALEILLLEYRGIRGVSVVVIIIMIVGVGRQKRAACHIATFTKQLILELN